jgi:5-methylcytosine-specific restriction endonuclease McrA
MWKGGMSYWMPGRFGKDINGLSWKKQRRLAWERDSYKCRRCGRGGVIVKPCVHHVIPYRISKSHSLENLICLCKKCHGIVEASTTD